MEVNNLLDPVNINGSTFINVNVSVDPFPFGVYECKAINPLGESMKIITFKEGFVPDVIKNVSYSRVPKGEMFVWRAPIIVTKV